MFWGELLLLTNWYRAVCPRRARYPSAVNSADTIDEASALADLRHSHCQLYPARSRIRRKRRKNNEHTRETGQKNRGEVGAGVHRPSYRFASAGAVAEGRAKPEDSGPRGGSSVTLSSGAQIYYLEDWFGEPWLDPEPVVFLHGDLEKGEIWYGWVPRMAQHYRLFRLDLPGFGRSTVPANFEWSLPNLARALGSFLDAVGVPSAHIIGAKQEAHWRCILRRRIRNACARWW